MELGDLLKKYDESIEFDFSEGSDTHGLSGECLCFTVRDVKEEIVDGYILEPNDIGSIY